MTKTFPQTPEFAGLNEPTRLEAELYDLVVEGEIPAEIDGSWYRLTPDPQFPPKFEDDTYLSGDGMLSRFRFHDGHVDYVSRYVRTERFNNERAARRALYGHYRNPYTDDESVAFKGNRTVANTTPIFHGGRLFALKEDSRPIEVDPETMETIGEWDFNGKLKSETMTAHPRYEPDTGYLHSYGYEADGLASKMISYFVIDRDGELIREEWFEAPFCSLVHDFLVTEKHVIFPLSPTTCDFDRVKEGGPHWVWDPNLPTYVGIMPRDGTAKDMRWFKGPPTSSFHFMNAYTEGDKVHMDFGYAKTNQFPFIRAVSNVEFNPQDMMVPYVRWTFDLGSDSDTWEERPLGMGGDFPRVADKDHMKDYEIGYYLNYVPENGPPIMAGPVMVAFNTISRINVKTGELRSFSLGPGTTCNEHIHVPSSKPGHEGYLIYISDDANTTLAEVIILEAEHPEKGPLARIKMPIRLRAQVHGNWVPADVLAGVQARKEAAE